MRFQQNAILLVMLMGNYRFATARPDPGPYDFFVENTLRDKYLSYFKLDFFPGYFRGIATGVIPFN